MTESTPSNGRRTATRLALISLLTAVALVGPVAAPSEAEQDDILPEGELELSLTRDADGATDTVDLFCYLTFPDGGTHPTPTAACDSLRAVGGDFDQLPEDSAACTREFDPHTAKATGWWDGEEVSYEETFPNRCLAAIGTDYVFDF